MRADGRGDEPVLEGQRRLRARRRRAVGGAGEISAAGKTALHVQAGVHACHHGDGVGHGVGHGGSSATMGIEREFSENLVVLLGSKKLAPFCSEAPAFVRKNIRSTKDESSERERSYLLER